MRLIIPLILLGGGVMFLGDGVWIHAKANFAQYLIEDAWQQTLKTGQTHKPWPWADTWPVMRLTFLQQQQSLLVLQGDSGRTLAFGPGHASESEYPGKMGVVMISGHRDTHFSILESIQYENEIEIETIEGIFRYKVSEIQIVDTSKEYLVNDPDSTALVLVTCYPFDALLPGGSLRYVVIADQMLIQGDTHKVSVN